ncbi:hypothetical protein M484_524 [Yersinia pestis 8787]|nr:hypothetical protein BZ16_1784 [Yersinia pseudotuberculosis PB1/+]AKS58531.1 hypothetical protein M479_907 [Yersinia pestis 1412]AKS89664.1 hypothetical protein M484_524 [Yersinia pestis 8787]KGA52536.1 hypothetical protein DJ56_947 [Yersinia pestis]KNC58716.1 hypothetical protein M476_917 [Yersinia pestis 1670]CFQ74581.1 Uncharacterised protein [Yersinia pseudotuberculosis]CQD49587.1 Uncharacterised protein [Yersinia intermedia]
MLRRVKEPGGTKRTDHWRIGALSIGILSIGILNIGILKMSALTIARMTASDSVWMRLWPNNHVYGLIMVLLTRDGVVFRSLS